MNYIISLSDVTAADRNQVGGKSYALSRLLGQKIPMPKTICIPVEVYHEFVDVTGVRQRILLELNRKSFDDMRWEEIWDAALRIKNLFLKTPFPEPMQSALADAVKNHFGNQAVAVRSSALGEDGAERSFAGLHDSFINIRGVQAVLDHIRLVWASLWSDRALLYRKELSLDYASSAMAVTVQEIIAGDASGVAFGQHPNNPAQALIEAVYGLNQGLVDGDVEPDAWVLDRNSGAILSRRTPERKDAMRPSENGVRLKPLDEKQRQTPPVSDEQIRQIYGLLCSAETLFGASQDVEWTFKKRLYALQSRPITTLTGSDDDDERKWHMSQHRSLEHLKILSRRVESELLPQMAREANAFDGHDLSSLSNSRLKEVIRERMVCYQKWKKVYWDEFIPLAHGIRLFGDAYNRMVRPDNPFEFVDALKNTGLMGLRRNRMLADLAEMIRRGPKLSDSLKQSGEIPRSDEAFETRLNEFLSRFGDGAWGETVVGNRELLVKMLLEMARGETPSVSTPADAPQRLAEKFLNCFKEEEKSIGEDLLALGKASYRLRDDDNLYLGRIEGLMIKALQEGRNRMRLSEDPLLEELVPKEAEQLLKNPDHQNDEDRAVLLQPADPSISARQIVGQAAGPGIARGKARVVKEASELFSMKRGEILVCDAIDPNMTFVIPLAAGIVERRGGMLIHGAIIAREYGIPCVTGAPDAARRIATGDEVTVDGYLGIVIRHA